MSHPPTALPESRQTLRPPQRSAASLYPERSSGFTLMELLVTISIIALLAAILLPTINTVIARSEKAEARAEVHAIATSIQAYYNEYSKLPISSGHGGSDVNLQGNSSKATLKALMGYDVDMNPREIPFLKSQTEVVTGNEGEFLDPWDNQYGIVIDASYDGKVTMNGNDVNDICVVYSWGPDASNNSGGGDDITSIQRD